MIIIFFWSVIVVFSTKTLQTLTPLACELHILFLIVLNYLRIVPNRSIHSILGHPDIDLCFFSVFLISFERFDCQYFDPVDNYHIWKIQNLTTIFQQDDTNPLNGNITHMCETVFEVWSTNLWRKKINCRTWKWTGLSLKHRQNTWPQLVPTNQLPIFFQGIDAVCEHKLAFKVLDLSIFHFNICWRNLFCVQVVLKCPKHLPAQCIDCDSGDNACSVDVCAPWQGFTKKTRETNEPECNAYKGSHK